MHFDRQPLGTQGKGDSGWDEWAWGWEGAEGLSSKAGAVVRGAVTPAEAPSLRIQRSPTLKGCCSKRVNMCEAPTHGRCSLIEGLKPGVTNPMSTGGSMQHSGDRHGLTRGNGWDERTF